MIQCLHTWQNAHHDMSSCCLSPYKVNTILLTVFPILYITSPQFTHCYTTFGPFRNCITGNVYILIPFTRFSLLPKPSLLWKPPVLSLSMSLDFAYLVWFVCWIPHIREIRWYSICLSQSDSLHLASMDGP